MPKNGQKIAKKLPKLCEKLSKFCYLGTVGEEK
jgi:hypothetical protein